MPDSRAYSKAYYDRLKADPVRWAAYIQSKVDKQRERRARLRNQSEESKESSKPVIPHVDVRTEGSPVVTEESVDEGVYRDFFLDTEESQDG